jgi:DNA-binding transcriptional MerR regulator
LTPQEIGLRYKLVMASAAPTPDSSADSEKSLFRIGEVSRLTATKTFVLRYWETEFPMLEPVKSPSGHRLYRREDIETVFEIKRLLYEEGFTIAGARKYLEGHGEEASGAAEGTSSGSRPEVRAHTSAPRREPASRQQRKFLLDLHEELLAVLTLLERE